MITHVSVAVMYVADQDRSLDFYVGKLGFRKKVDREMWPGACRLEITPNCRRHQETWLSH